MVVIFSYYFLGNLLALSPLNRVEKYTLSHRQPDEESIVKPIERIKGSSEDILDPALEANFSAHGGLTRTIFLGRSWSFSCRSVSYSLFGSFLNP